MNPNKQSSVFRLALFSSLMALLAACGALKPAPESQSPKIYAFPQISRHSCGSSVGGTSTPVAKWVGPGHLEVEAWAYETPGSMIFPSNEPVIVGEDNTLIVFYSVGYLKRKEEGPVVACMWPVKLRFTIYDLPQADYKISVRQDASK